MDKDFLLCGPVKDNQIGNGSEVASYHSQGKVSTQVPGYQSRRLAWEKPAKLDE